MKSEIEYRPIMIFCESFQTIKWLQKNLFVKMPGGALPFLPHWTRRHCVDRYLYIASKNERIAKLWILFRLTLNRVANQTQ